MHVIEMENIFEGITKLLNNMTLLNSLGNKIY